MIRSRIFTLLLVIVMVTGLFIPAAAFAADGAGMTGESVTDGDGFATPTTAEEAGPDAEQTAEPVAPDIPAASAEVTPSETEAEPDKEPDKEPDAVPEDIGFADDGTGADETSGEDIPAADETPAEPSKVEAAPGYEPGAVEWSQRFSPMLANTQSGRVANPYIVYTYSPAILNGASPIIFTDTTTGMPAYCIDYNRGVPSPDSLDGENDFDPETIFDPDTYEGLKCLLLAGYPYETGGLTDAEAQGCTQLAVWCWTYETMGYGLNAANYSAISGKEYIYDYFTGLMEAARNRVRPDLELTAADVLMVMDGDTLAGETAVYFRNLTGGYTLDESRLPEGMTVTGYTGGDGDTLVFTAPLAYAGQSLVLESILSGHDERSELNLFWYDNKNASQQRMAVSVTDSATAAVTANIAMEFQGVGAINLVKVSADKQAVLAGAVFGVYDTATDELLCELTTDESGGASVTLPYGDYYLRELSAPEGFRLSADRYPALLEAEAIEITVPNVPTGGALKLFKADKNDSGLPDAVFGVYRASDDSEVCKLTTGADGRAETALPVGEFYLLELAAPDGFQKSGERVPFTIKDNETTEVTAINTPLPEEPKDGYLRLIKAAQGTAARLPGAVFGVYDAAADELLCELTTNGNGEASVTLPQGDYYLRELKCDGYILITGKIPFRINVGETRTETVTNAPVPAADGTLKLIKESTDRDRLPGAVFGVYRAEDDVKVAELTTNSKGEAVRDLPEGDYYLKELRCDGYKLVEGKIAFNIREGVTKELSVINEKLPASDMGTLLVTKKAERSGRMLPDAVFGVYTVASNVKVAELTTANDGMASIELASGDYYLKELKAPVSYIAEPDKIPFTIKTGVKVHITVTNTQGRGTLRLLKTDGGGRPLQDGVFTLYRQDGARVAELTTGQDGTAIYELPIGGYYLVEKTAPAGFKPDGQKYSFTVEHGKEAGVKIVNMALGGTVEVYFRHVRDGRELAPMKSYTDKVGSDYVRWMRQSGYENMPIEGFTLLRTDYPGSFVLVEGKLTVTLWYSDPPGTIYVPKTGEAPPMLNYAFALFSWGMAALCGFAFYRMRKQTKGI